MMPLRRCWLLFPLALTGCGQGASPQEIAPLPVEIAKPSASGQGVIVGTGRVEREREIALSFRVPGVIARLHVDMGDRVRKGQLLAELDGRDLAARLRQASGDVMRAERAVARYEGLSTEGAVARARYEDERTALDQARAAQAAAAYDRSSGRLLAPAGGIVLQRSVQGGETVSAGQQIVRVSDGASALIVRASIPGDRLPDIRPGAQARVTIQGGTGPLTGHVSRIGQQVASGTGTAEVEISLPADAALASGLTAHVEIGAVAKQEAAALRLPPEAVVEAKDGKAVLFLLDRRQSRARRIVVRFRGFSGEEALVEGLAPDADVITSGAGFVTDGQRVQITGAAR